MPITKIEEGGQGIPYDSKTGEEFPVQQQTVSSPKTNASYQKGYEEGYNEGFHAGYDDGYRDGKADCEKKSNVSNKIWEIFGENGNDSRTFLVFADTFDNAVKKFKEAKKGYNILSIRMLNNIL